MSNNIKRISSYNFRNQDLEVELKVNTFIQSASNGKAITHIVKVEFVGGFPKFSSYHHNQGTFEHGDLKNWEQLDDTRGHVLEFGEGNVTITYEEQYDDQNHFMVSAQILNNLLGELNEDFLISK